MIKKIRISVSVLGLIVLFSIVFNSIVNAMQIDINMNRSFYETFSGGRRVEYQMMIQLNTQNIGLMDI